ncbi:hypothetical protein B8W66_17615 [Mycobacterium decipiens]|uniref:Uncharacterized protein n=1 Tax=Mycobacterium decipiens TaxID=1430326 RepID=A0A1X2LRM6_9MYCO|nr:hypothetical protein B8W66_17615 [Mycobacterium decipiens]
MATDPNGGDPPRPATPRLRSPPTQMVATRHARPPRACDRHGPLLVGWMGLAVSLGFSRNR